MSADGWDEEESCLDDQEPKPEEHELEFVFGLGDPHPREIRCTCSAVYRVAGP